MAGEAKAIAKLDEWVNRLRTTGQAVEAAAVEVAGLLQTEAEAAVREQRSMDGTKWPPTKEGTPALRNAAANIETKARGSVVQMILTGHHVYHHFGAGRSPRRPILPMGGTPAKLGNAIRLGIVHMGEEWMNRNRGHRGRGTFRGAKPTKAK